MLRCSTSAHVVNARLARNCKLARRRCSGRNRTSDGGQREGQAGEPHGREHQSPIAVLGPAEQQRGGKQRH